MNPEIKKEWLQALRSGKYVQGHWALHLKTLAGESRFCCLGVLADLYAQATQTPWERRDPECLILGATTALPPPVVLWAGLSPKDPTVEIRHASRLTTLAKLNDVTRLTFPQIADVIAPNL